MPVTQGTPLQHELLQSPNLKFLPSSAFIVQACLVLCQHNPRPPPMATVLASER